MSLFISIGEPVFRQHVAERERAGEKNNNCTAGCGVLLNARDTLEISRLSNAGVHLSTCSFMGNRETSPRSTRDRDDYQLFNGPFVRLHWAIWPEHSSVRALIVPNLLSIWFHPRKLHNSFHTFLHIALFLYFLFACIIVQTLFPFFRFPDDVSSNFYF